MQPTATLAAALMALLALAALRSRWGLLSAERRPDAAFSAPAAALRSNG